MTNDYCATLLDALLRCLAGHGRAVDGNKSGEGLLLLRQMLNYQHCYDRGSNWRR